MPEMTVSLPVTVDKVPGRGAGYVARYLGSDAYAYPHGWLEATGATPAKAKAALADALATALQSCVQRPRFARDDAGATWVAIPAPDGGSVEYRITGEKARVCSLTSRPAGEAFTDSVGMEVIPGP